MPDHADRLSRIHHLFNELHRELTNDLDHNRDSELLNIRTAVDAAHHDFTDLTLQEIT